MKKIKVLFATVLIVGAMGVANATIDLQDKVQVKIGNPLNTSPEDFFCATFRHDSKGNTLVKVCFFCEC